MNLSRGSQAPGKAFDFELTRTRTKPQVQTWVILVVKVTQSTQKVIFGEVKNLENIM